MGSSPDSPYRYVGFSLGHSGTFSGKCHSVSRAIRGRTLAWRMSVAVNTSKELFSKFILTRILACITTDSRACLQNCVQTLTRLDELSRKTHGFVRTESRKHKNPHTNTQNLREWSCAQNAQLDTHRPWIGRLLMSNAILHHAYNIFASSGRS